ncbi:MAG: ornithine carbamoyltransferase [Planctomycetota bacterium]
MILQDTLVGRDLLSILDLTPDEIAGLVTAAIKLKSSPPDRTLLAGVGVSVLFEKPSLRTRASFEFGLAGMGAHPAIFDLAPTRIGERESVKDYAMNLERWCDAIVARVFDHGVLEDMARHASVPVVNALSDTEHPCQALADLLTIREALGTLAGKSIAYIGDGNNVCHSLMLAAASVGMRITVITPDGHAPSERFVQAAKDRANETGGSVRVAHEADAVRGHDVVYTDTWTSMGQSESNAKWFEPFRVDDTLMSIAADGTNRGSDADPIFMHCLPATRGREVAASVIDGPASVVYDQAENRMHAQNALMLALLGKGGGN